MSDNVETTKTNRLYAFLSSSKLGWSAQRWNRIIEENTNGSLLIKLQ